LAKPKVALTQIEGDASGDVRDAVAEALEGKELSLIGSREVNRAVDKLGDLADLTEKDFKKLASELEAEAIIAGKLEKVGTAKTLKFRLFVHKKMAKGFTVSFKDAKSEKFRTMLHDKMIDKIGLSGGGEDEEAKPAKKKKGADDEEDPLAGKKGKKGKAVAAAEEDEAKPAKKGKGAKAAADDEEAKPAKKGKGKASDAEEEEARPSKKAKAAAAEDEEAKPSKKAKAAAAQAQADEEEPTAKPAKKAEADDEAKPAADDARPAKKAEGDDEDAPRKGKKKVAAADDGEEVEGRLTATAEPRRGANQAMARVDIGASVVQHTFKFNANASAPNKPKNVSISPVPGARLAGELYPLAGSRGALSGLGIGFSYDKTLKLNLTATDPNNTMTFAVPGKQSDYSIGVRFRHAFGSSETSSTLTLGVGYGKRLFSTDLSKVNDDVAVKAVRRDTPETNYTIIDPSLMFRMPVTRMVAFQIGGRGLVITGAGPIQGPTSYGRARVYGGEAVAAVDVVLGSHLALRFSGEYTQIGYSFMGGGTTSLANNLDNDPTSLDVGGLADRSIGGAATLAVIY
jgi:hypothetical protein